jgi:hypothetical protein
MIPESEFPAYFWAKVDIRSENECWEWNGTILDSGYGTIRFLTKPQRAHRLAFYLKNGYFPKEVLHHICHNKRCCNVRHLVEMTTLEHNKLNSMERSPETFAYGEKNAMAKTTWAVVGEVRRLRQEEGWDYQTISNRLDISVGQVGKIVRHERWKVAPPTNHAQGTCSAGSP